MDTRVLSSLSAGASLIHATVTNIGSNSIELSDGEGRRIEADLLYSSDDMPLTLVPGDQVLALTDAARGTLILGRVGQTHSPHAAVDHGPPDELVLAAKSNLTLKCGDGSITIRQDGKILIKGKNLVSLALETNRIKGGSVAIN